MDEAIASLLGWTRRQGAVFSHESAWCPPGSTSWDWVPEHSTKDAVALDALHSLPKDRAGICRWYWTLGSGPSGYEFSLWRADGDKWMAGRRFTRSAHTIALAICRSLLAAAAAEMLP